MGQDACLYMAGAHMSLQKFRKIKFVAAIVN